METQAEYSVPADDPLHKMHCLAYRGLCARCANLTHSHEDGAAYCIDSGGWWITVKIQECESYSPLDTAGEKAYNGSVE